MTIVLKRDFEANCWTASRRTSAGEADPKTVALFGTHIIPTSFTTQASAEEVLRTISSLNPDCKVYAVLEAVPA